MIITYSQSLSFLFINKTLQLNNLKKLEQLLMRKFQCLLFVLKRSYICDYILCMTVPLSVNSRFMGIIKDSFNPLVPGVP